MSVASARKILELSQADNPRLAILKAIGDLGKAEVFSDLVLVGTFIRNEKTKGGIIQPKEVVEEDQWQGKVGLVLKTGPLAYFDHESDADRGGNAPVGAWVVYAIKDGWGIEINGVPCRLIPYDKIRMRIADPELVY